MMKGFNVFKLLGIAILASGLMVAGCGNPSASDTADQVKDAVNQGAFTIPVTVDPAAHSLTFGNGGASAIGVFNGHTVEVQNASACSGPLTAVSCTIKVINRDSDEFMTNATLLLSFCVDCVAGQNFHNADCTGSPCVRTGGLVDPLVSLGNSGLNANTAVSSQNGYCLAEDGNYTVAAPYTDKGCLGHVTLAGSGPAQHLAPACGDRDVRWDFATTDGTHFTFYANVTGVWHPMDLSADSRVNAADMDNRTTLMVMIVDLDEPGTDLGAPLVGPNWNVGAYRHSTVLAGNGAATNHVTLSQKKYFALNIAVEYPNRIELEKQGFRQATGFADYEYYVQLNFILRFNPAVVTPHQGTDGGPIYVGSVTTVGFGGKDLCLNCASTTTTAAQRRMFDSVTSLEPHGASNSVITFADKGYVYSFVNVNTNTFSWNNAAAAGVAQTYYDTDGQFVCTRLANMWPINAGHAGAIHMNHLVKPCTNRATPPAGMLKTLQSTTIVDEAPDAAPDLAIGMYFFKVMPVGGGTSTVGSGTMFFPEQFSNYAGYILSWTGGTDIGGSAAGSDDWVSMCIPMDPLYINAVDQGCDPAQGMPVPDEDWIWKNSEQSNSKMSQTGFSTPGNGVFQAQTASMCVGL